MGTKVNFSLNDTCALGAEGLGRWGRKQHQLASPGMEPRPHELGYSSTLSMSCPRYSLHSMSGAKGKGTLIY